MQGFHILIPNRLNARNGHLDWRARDFSVPFNLANLPAILAAFIPPSDGTSKSFECVRCSGATNETDRPSEFYFSLNGFILVPPQ